MTHISFKTFLDESSYQKCEIQYSNKHSSHNKLLNKAEPKEVSKQIITPNFLNVVEFSVKSGRKSNQITKATLFDFVLFENGTAVIKFDCDIDEEYRDTQFASGYKEMGIFIKDKELNYLAQGKEITLLGNDWMENIFKIRVKPGKEFFNLLDKEKETSNFLYALSRLDKKLLSLTSYKVIMNELWYYK